MHFTEQPKQLLERLMNHALDHFQIDNKSNSIVITYKDKECQVFSESVEPIYEQAFEAYQREARIYQEKVRKYEQVEQNYLLENGVTAEKLAHHQEQIKKYTPKDYSQWYKEVIIDIINDDKENFEKAIESIL